MKVDNEHDKLADKWESEWRELNQKGIDLYGGGEFEESMKVDIKVRAIKQCCTELRKINPKRRGILDW